MQGLLQLSPAGVVLYLLALTHVTIAAVTIFLHRHQAHRALELHPVVSHFFRLWLWLTTGMVTRQWVAIHRKHHAHCEGAADPHSPQRQGLRRVLWQGAELYRREAASARTLERYGKGTPDDLLERRLYSAHPYAGIGLMLLVDLTLLGPIGLSVWALQMIWIPFWAAGVINGLGHYWGYRNYASADASTNLLPWGLLIGGEELHNNHHAYPGSARLSARPWELDLGWLYIRLFAALGLARVNKTAPRPARLQSGISLNGEALRAMARHRLQVLGLYSRQVVRRVYRQELRRLSGEARQLLKRARLPVLRGALDEQAEQTLAGALGQSERLATVHQFGERLQQIWRQAASSQERAVEGLQEWCRQAEASGIEALQRFARSLGGGRPGEDVTA